MTELKIPEVGESVQEALLAQWLKRDGESVGKDDILFVIETDKVTLEISAPADGVLKILVQEGTTVKIGTVVGLLEEAAAGKAPEMVESPAVAPQKDAAPTEPAGPAPTGSPPAEVPPGKPAEAAPPPPPKAQEVEAPTGGQTPPSP